MAVRGVLFAFVGTVALASHYEKPPCQSDELAGRLAGGAELCAPKCTNGSCPSDVPAGTTAQPQCVLVDAQQNRYCGLVCQAANQCPSAGQCTKVPGSAAGLCTYSASQHMDVQVRTDVFTVASNSETKFVEFMEAAGRIYSSIEEQATRFIIFKENLLKIEKMQSMDSSAFYSHVSPYADWSVEEFAKRNTLKADHFDQLLAPQDDLYKTSDLPTSFDWREKGAVNPVKNQGQCGSCWAFATVANVEGVNFVKTNQLVSLSEQELVDCDKTTGDQGCQGGLPANAYKDMIASKIGLELETVYPYAAAQQQCAAKAADEKVFISSWKQISTDEDQMAAALIANGPLAIGINAGPMQWYKGGVSNPWKFQCSPTSLDHGVAIVGFGEDQGIFGKKYWTIRNSWGPSWGENGYYRIIRGTGACGLNTMVTTAGMSSSETIVV